MAFGLVAHLYLVDGTSDKFHESTLTGTLVIAHYGRRGSGGAIALKNFATEPEAAAYYWGLLRSKVGKGYHVKDAATFVIPTDLVGIRPRYASPEVSRILYAGEGALTDPNRGYWNVEYGRVQAGRSPRTPKQGKDILLSLVSDEPDLNTIVACAVAPETEKFLRGMAVTHPNCPDEALVASALQNELAALL